MREVFINWEEQLNYMESNVGDSGCSCYESARDDMIEGLRLQHGISARLVLEDIPDDELEAFIKWVEE